MMAQARPLAPTRREDGGAFATLCAVLSRRVVKSWHGPCLGMMAIEFNPWCRPAGLITLLI